MARPVWSGTLSFGLVNVPVKAFTAVRDHSIHFHQLQKGTGARIRNKKVSDKTGRAVDADDIEMGYEIREGRYVTFDKEELADLRPASTRAVDVTDFVALEDIDPMFYERTYWLAPADDHAKEAYQLLHAAMEDRQRVGIGTVVMRNTQYLTAIRPIDQVLAMSTMRFADEIVPRTDVDGLPTRRAKPKGKTMELALQIVDALASEWDPKRYHDTYTEELESLIEKKDKGEEVVVEAEADDGDGKLEDLMAALEASVAKGKARRTTSTAKAAGPRRRSRSTTTSKKRAPAKKAS